MSGDKVEQLTWLRDMLVVLETSAAANEKDLESDRLGIAAVKNAIAAIESGQSPSVDAVTINPLMKAVEDSKDAQR